MNQILQKKTPLLGAAFMVASGLCFAIGNGLTSTIVYGLGFKPQSDAFYQYAIALIIGLPILFRYGRNALKTKHIGINVVRAVLSALGVQAFVMCFAYGLPLWKIVVLVMTSPFFILLGAGLILREKVGPERWVAAAVGFLGGLVVVQPWAQSFSWADLLPVVAAILWGIVSLMTKKLTAEEPSENITVWLLLLLTPINLALSVKAGFEVPGGQILIYLLIGGLVTYLANFLLTKSYAVADAAFVQPFDDLKLLSNLAVSWFLGVQLPEGNLWLGIALIAGASAYLVWRERNKDKFAPQPA
ncbi:DMT family transporter [Aestuariivirga litoralis]|uniref:DMT family transporter n=1 Tax=Aestuariivirga litoralis TaxID=2650924 RepID=UPI0018C54603|nr:DMT family transporter [Aestuariivirga litoralis]MBG1231801.1 DMT family transporter [Aestuariivirga litoralis]